MRIHFSQFHAGVDADDLLRIRNLERHDEMPRALEYLSHIGEVVLMRGIVRLDLADMLPQQVRPEAVDSRIHEFQEQLFGRGRLLLHDRRDMPFPVEDDAAVAAWIFEPRRDQRCRGARSRLRLDED